MSLACLLACTLCHTDLAEEIRSGIFAGDFLLNLAQTILPILVVGTVALVVGEERRK